MIKTIRVQLLPNNKQKTLLKKCADAARWAYNWALSRQLENFKKGGNFINDGELRKELTQLKKTPEYDWLNEVSAQIPKQAVKDLCAAYKNFFRIENKHYSEKTKKKALRQGRQLTVYDLEGHPKFKSKRDIQQGFYHREDAGHLKFEGNRVKLEKIGWVKLAEKRIELMKANKFYNPRIKFDGFNWFITVGVDCQLVDNQEYSDGIGIDLGIKDLAVINDGRKIANINKTHEVKRLNKKLKRLQRKLSRKYEKQKEGGENRYKKTKNIIKLERLIRRVHKRIKDIRTNYLHQETAKLVKTKPEYVCMEDINVKGIIKNHKLAKSIQEQTFSEFRRIMEYKCKWNSIRFIVADRYYPSSKTCSECGYVLDKLSLSTRKWICPKCGIIHDRDVNAAINLMKYGKSA